MAEGMTGRWIAGGVLAAALVLGTGLALRRRDAPVASAYRAPVSMPAAVPPAVPKPVMPPPAPVDPSAYVVKRVLKIDAPLRQGDHYWDETGAPKSGPIIITVDLKAQVLSIFRDGYEIGTSVVIFGADNMPTPLGVYPITQKDADHVSNLYDAPMPYMLRLTNDGISIHGSKVGEQYATHGCIGVPVAFAKKLFGAVKLGDKVIVTSGEMLDVGQPITAA